MAYKILKYKYLFYVLPMPKPFTLDDWVELCVVRSCVHQRLNTVETIIWSALTLPIKLPVLIIALPFAIIDSCKQAPVVERDYKL
jgi:hypothetical protein